MIGFGASELVMLRGALVTFLCNARGVKPDVKWKTGELDRALRDAWRLYRTIEGK